MSEVCIDMSLSSGTGLNLKLSFSVDMKVETKQNRIHARQRGQLAVCMTGLISYNCFDRPKDAVVTQLKGRPKPRIGLFHELYLIVNVRD